MKNDPQKECDEDKSHSLLFFPLTPSHGRADHVILLKTLEAVVFIHTRG